MLEQKIKEELGEMLVKREFITRKQLERAQKKAEEENKELDKAIIELGFISEKEVYQILAEDLGFEFLDLSEFELKPELSQFLPDNIAKRYNAVPVKFDGEKLVVAMIDPLDTNAVDDIMLMTGLEVETVMATETDIRRAINRIYGSAEIAEADDLSSSIAEVNIGELSNLEIGELEEEEISVDKLKEMVDEAPIVKLVNQIIFHAISDKASDIHIEPWPKEVVVRYRMDGILHEIMRIPKHLLAPMVSRIKIMSALDIAERRKPQDGKIHLKYEGRDFDLRVSTIPTVNGEKVVMRILDKSSVMLGLDRLGFMPDIRERLEWLIAKPYGMILVTGPTGSGKSTTLYACLNKLNQGTVNISTVEDPVEYQIQGINQVQVNPKAGVTFASALRAFLRQDPDIIMVGEIRDHETAQIAVEAALTGHLVLSTLHTNDAPSAATRLIEMGIEPFLVSSAVVGVLAQRLARTICSACKEPYVPPKEALKDIGLAYTEEEIVFYKGRGCEVCKGSGYKGRTGIHELLIMSDAAREVILRRGSANEIKRAVLEEGFKTLQDDAIRKVLEGIISVEEALRVVFMGNA
ncbi:MAG: type IV-A pilus assembly ATPase PilB [Candidatus Calescibacterium sp.]|nr:type IV-A pilus assembly ATPase PilB [Candidatus Calescibacterium sp.]MDW8133247.1 type IV-A pilus assembly ATPase PilB [Candidatus Calescibacterium sp.]